MRWFNPITLLVLTLLALGTTLIALSILFYPNTNLPAYYIELSRSSGIEFYSGALLTYVFWLIERRSRAQESQEQEKIVFQETIHRLQQQLEDIQNSQARLESQLATLPKQPQSGQRFVRWFRR